MTYDKGYVDPEYLRIAAEQLTQLKRRSYTLMHIGPGDHALDVGCGPGTDTIPLAQLVGHTGRVVGIDSDPDMIAKAQARAAEAAVNGWVSHQRGDALSLPFAYGEFNSCRSERLFQHLLDPHKALSEMMRITKPGGWIVVLDTDWGTMSIDTQDVAIERLLARIHAEQLLHNGYAGRQLYRLFKEQGLRDVAIEIYPASVTNYPLARTMALMDETEQTALDSGIITQVQLQHWRSSLESAAEKGLFFGTVNVVVASVQRA